MIKHKLPRLSIICLFTGLVPALVILLLIRFEDGRLLVAGQAMADYSTARLTAGLISTMTPILLLVAPAWALEETEFSIVKMLQPLSAPFLLLGPCILAALAVGGGGAGLPLAALLLLGLLTLAYLLWFRLLEGLLGRAPALLLYGLAWACSGFLGYLNEYVLPYLELGVLDAAGWLIWIVPQLISGPTAVDGFLDGASFWRPFLPTMVQIPFLALLLRLPRFRSKAPAHPPD